MSVPVEVVVVGWDDDDAARLRARQQAELRERYGDDDIGHAMTGDEIVAMVLLREAGAAVACGAIRDASADQGPGVGELKRMFVVPEARGRGHARRVLVELERIAVERGFTRLVLETGVLQPDAIGLYLTAGYRSIANYGEYVQVADSRCFARDLVGPARERPGRTTSARGVVVEAVPYDDETALALRRRMWDFNAASYPELYGEDGTVGGFEADDARQAPGMIATLVGRVDGEPVACLCLRAARDGYPERSGELKKVFVREEARGAGVARALLAAADEVAAERGLSSIVLTTGIRQPEAVTLYLSAGWRPCLPFTDPTGDWVSLWFSRPVPDVADPVPAQEKHRA
ncbi:GNAT family N-acetyltransferase [Cellulomonas composti]|uniref:N-acetyltransferase domain-containing protein n=1 Tax=Cellulomonas composti TaxID=266130 RepID=A0A511JD78_9CELL|nr:GNAT family N-acetyltransferase [Cellulomonas composti]GEL95957.1 hypothetical protein CCO02nite_26150 [Cellulomonas composti]